MWYSIESSIWVWNICLNRGTIVESGAANYWLREFYYLKTGSDKNMFQTNPDISKHPLTQSKPLVQQTSTHPSFTAVYICYITSMCSFNYRQYTCMFNRVGCLFCWCWWKSLPSLCKPFFTMWYSIERLYNKCILSIIKATRTSYITNVYCL
jgi:hypothetical protein